MATWNLNIEMKDEGGSVCEFSKDTRSMHSHLVDMYVTGDLAFQAMALGKESMSGWWCMLCKTSGNNSWMSTEQDVDNGL